MKKLMYIVFFLVMAINLLAQETYVIDSVCVGADRSYRMDGEKGSTYEWNIYNASDSSLFASPLYTDYRLDNDPNPGDTIWGSEINQLWDIVGEYDIEVLHWSLHGCDTVEIGHIKVFDPPEAEAGPSRVICSIEDILISGDTAWNYRSFDWTSTGDGTFSSATQLHPIYFLGAVDSLNQSVTLILTAYGLADNITCTPAVDSATFLFSEPEINFSVTELLCYNDSNAEIKASITDGQPPYTYAWTGPSGFVSKNLDEITGLWAGTYELTVTDANGCSDVESVEIVNPPELELSINNVQHVSCYGYADAFIYSSAIGGTGVLTFTLTGASGYTASGDSINNLSGDTYLITVTDENGCTDTATVVITEPDPLIAVIDNSMDITCYGYNNGAAHVTVTDGTGPYTYSWNTVPAQDSVWATNLGPGEYVAAITDFNGCMAWDSVIINEPPPLALVADSLDARCDGGKPGEIDLTISGGTPFANAPYYNFQWTNEAGNIFATTEDINGLSGNQFYTVLVTDSLDCQITRQVFINEIPMMELAASVDSALCYGDPWTIDLTVTKGRPAYSYEWKNSGGVVISTTQDMIDVPAGFYEVKVSDSDTCELTMQFNLEEPDLLLAEIVAADSVLCEGDEVILAGSPIGGTGSITHSWSGNGAVYLSETSAIAPFFRNAPAGNYEVIYTIVDEANCDASDTIEINVYPPSYSFDSLEICMGEAPFLWNSRTIVSDRDSIYLDTLVNQYGCDSLLTMEVDVLFPVYDDTTLYVCENEEPFVVFSQTILPDRDSIYLDTVRYVESGCDSLLITVNVFTLPISDTLLDTTLCAGAPTYVWNSHTILTEHDSIYLDTLANVYGCDSLLTYDVKIIPPDTFYVDSTFCQDEPEFVWNGLTIFSQFDSIYIATLTNIYGCDSLVNLNVTIVPSTDTIIDTMFCQGEPAYAWNNLVILSDHDSTYLDTLVNAAGCDSLLTLNVTILYPDTVYIDTTLCEGVAPFVWNSHNVFALQDSVYRDTLQNVFGCDSLVSLDVRILLPYDSIQTLEICANEPQFSWYTHTVLPDRDSIYFDTLYYDAGCDSLRLKLEIITLPVSDTVMDMIVCEGSPGFVWNSHTISTFVDGTYQDTLTNVWGCDSTLTLNVDVVPAFKDTIPEVICYGEPLADWYGQTIVTNVDSIYIHNVLDPSGCDTLLFYDVTILPVTDTLLDLTLCAGLPEFMWNNRLISTTHDSIYLDTLTNSYGCDSLLTYDITIIPPDTFYVDTVICRGDPAFVWNTIDIQTNTEDSYEANLTNMLGCDSVVILTVEIVDGISVDTFVAACDSFIWLEGDGNTYTETGVYEYVVGNGACADSFRLDLSISLPFDLDADIIPVTCYGYSDGSIDVTMLSGISPYSYLWNTGDTTSNINNLPAGIYEVLITDALGCFDNLSFEITQPDSLHISETHVDLGDSYDPIGSIDLTVSGGTGPYTFDWSNGEITEDISDLAAGDYTVIVTDANNCTATLTVTLTTNVITDYRMDCLDEVVVICYEELAEHPIATTFEEYMAQDTTNEVFSNYGLDTMSFTYSDSVLTIGFCYAEERTYTITDSAGIVLGPCKQLVIVNDTEKPDLICPPTIIVTNGIAPDPYADLTEFRNEGGIATDNCGIVSFGQLGTDVSDGGSDPEIISRTYEVADSCGNTQICTQLIEMYLEDNFEMSCPDLSGSSFECDASNAPKYNILAQFTAAGGYVYSHPYPLVESSFRLDSEVSDGKKCPETITRTYSIENTSGEKITCSQEFTIDDVIKPTLSFRVRYITCDEYVPVYSTIYDVRQDGDLADDNCKDVFLTLTLMDLEVSGTCPKETKRIYRLTDACGNYTQAIQYIYENDTIAPVIVSTPDDIETDCFLPEPYADYAAFVDAGGLVTEECGTFDMLNMGDSVAGPSEPGVIYRTYRFSDLCNNYSDYIQKITVLDKEPPTIGIPDLTLDCEPVDIATLEVFIDYGGWFNDNCEIDSSSFKLFDADTIGAVCPRLYINRYEIYDMSGNRGWTEQTITVVDSSPPLLACPPNDTIDFTEAFPAPFATLDGFITTGGTTSDNCAVDSASFALVSADSVISDCESQITYTYIIADMCGNWSETCSYTIYKHDVTNPVLSCPDNLELECFNEVPPVFNTLAEFEAAGGIATDNNQINATSLVHMGDSTEGVSCPLIIIRYYSIEDICGNVATCSYQITVNDVTPPVITCPADTAIECLSNIIHNITTIEEFEAVGGKLYDNCEIDPSSFTARTETLYDLDKRTIVNHFSITDLCGNIDSCSQTITLTDTIPPVPVCNEITVYLDENGDYLLTEIDIETITAGTSDNCTAAEDLIIDVDVTDLTCLDVEEGKIINVVVTDEAGNSGVCMANIVVLDEIPPTAICQNIEVYLDENGEVTITADMIDNGSDDNCKLDSVLVWPANFDCTNVGDNVVQLYAVDAYGNRDTCEAIVTVIDQIPPVIFCIGKQTIQLDQNGLYELTWEMIADSVWDECGIDTVLLDKYLLDCDDIGTTFITATAYDVNGNSSSCQTEFEIFGNIAPNVVNDSAVTAMDIPVSINVVSNDYDLKTSINISTLGVLINPSHGSVVVDNKTGIVTYTPDFNYVGPDVFRYTICDDGIPCVPMCGDALVFITVRPSNLPPIAVDDYFEVPCGNLFGNVLEDNGNGPDSDPDGDDITVNTIPIVNPTSGVVILYDNGNFEYEPFVDFVGVDSFRYSICDNGIPSLCDTAWVYITRVADNDCDGVADVDDIDDDNDGILDVVEGDRMFDSDRDGIPDSYDIDSDNDGIPDNVEGQSENNYIPPTGRDSNGNGWDDAYDPENGGYPFTPEDTDGDSMPDFLDIDSDNDGVFDFIEGHDENADGIADVVRIYSDSDFDGLDDAYDTQPGWAMPGNETAGNAPLQDFDSDGVRDWRDTNDEDDPYETVNEDLNGDGDYSNDDLDLDGRPEYLDTEMDCELFIPEGFSPNDDGVHDFFQILCIYPRYPNAKLMIFNRNGQKLFEKENYGNYDVWGWNDAWWWGNSENTFTIGRSGGLPAGNYIYVLILNDGIGTVKNGTVMVAY